MGSVMQQLELGVDYEEEPLILKREKGTTDEPVFNAKFKETFGVLCSVVHKSAYSKGFWNPDISCNKPDTQECAVKAALIHGEVSEFVEAIRMPQMLPDKHLKNRMNYEVELADIVIRVMDLAEALRVDLASVILEKIQFNKSREPMHGKTF